MQALRQRGFTLTELLIVVTLLAIIAAVAIPDFSSGDRSKLDIAIADVVGAIRFAHSEAIRTGEPRGVHIERDQQRIRVYRLDTSVNPSALYYDVYDPLTKQLYDLNFGKNTFEVFIESTDIRYRGALFATGYLEFAGSTGVPRRDDSKNILLLDKAYIQLTYKGESAKLGVSPVTGRVTVQ